MFEVLRVLYEYIPSPCGRTTHHAVIGLSVQHVALLHAKPLRGRSRDGVLAEEEGVPVVLLQPAEDNNNMLEIFFGNKALSQLSHQFQASFFPSLFNAAPLHSLKYNSQRWNRRNRGAGWSW